MVILGFVVVFLYFFFFKWINLNKISARLLQPSSVIFSKDQQYFFKLMHQFGILNLLGSVFHTALNTMYNTTIFFIPCISFKANTKVLQMYLHPFLDNITVHYHYWLSSDCPRLNWTATAQRRSFAKKSSQPQQWHLNEHFTDTVGELLSFGSPELKYIALKFPLGCHPHT